MVPAINLLLVTRTPFTGMFARVPKADFKKLQVENGQLRQYNARLTKEGTFYYGQVQHYQAKFPKTAPYFSKYVTPATPAPAAE